VKMRFIERLHPFGTLILAEGIKDFVSYRKRKGVRTKLQPCERIREDTTTALSYLRYFNFFEYTNSPCGVGDHTSRFDRGYIPIEQINIEDLIAKNKSVPFQENIETLCKSYAESLLANRNIMLENLIGYCYREVIRNTFEHAETDHCTIMAQNWWSNDSFEIALVDKGIGILGSIQKQHNVRIAEEAIELALMPGASGKAMNIDDNEWGNTGFGLYILSELGSSFGTFSLFSSGVMVQIKNNTKSWTDIHIAGTGVKLQIDLTKIDVDYFPNIRESIVLKGEKIAKDTFGTERKASGKSLS